MVTTPAPVPPSKEVIGGLELTNDGQFLTIKIPVAGVPSLPGAVQPVVPGLTNPPGELLIETRKVAGALQYRVNGQTTWFRAKPVSGGVITLTFPPAQLNM